MMLSCPLEMLLVIVQSFAFERVFGGLLLVIGGMELLGLIFQVRLVANCL